MLISNLDLAALRTFVAAVDLGGFGKAARVVHRTPGAVSLQIKALEERLEQPLFIREGRRQRLTPAGETLLDYARRLLATNDEALLALRGMHVSGDVRLGMPQDLADSWLPSVLGRVARAHPSVRVQVQVGRSGELRQALEAGELDFAITFGAGDSGDRRQAARLDVRWWAHPDWLLADGAPVPLLVLDAPCLFRDAAVRALEQAGRPWRIAMSSSSVSAIWAAAAAGLGVTARTALSVPPPVRPLGASQLPSLAPVGLFAHAADTARHPIVDYLGALVREAFQPSGDAALRS